MVAARYFFGNVADFFFQISSCFSNNFSYFIKKDVHSVLSKSFPYALIFGRNMHKGLFFLRIFTANKIFKIVFTKRDLIRYYYFTNIYIIYQNRSLILVKFVFVNFSILNLYNFFIHFYVWF